MNSGDIMLIFDKLSIVLTAEIDESNCFSQPKDLDPAMMKLIKIFFAMSAFAIMILVAIIITTSSLEQSSALADLKSIVLDSCNANSVAIGTLHKRFVNLVMALQGLDKNYQTEFKDLNKKMDTFQTEVKDLRNLFVSSQKGQSAAADSALSISENGRYIACGTLARSPRFVEPVVITNRHAVADLVERCHYEITVRTGGSVDIPISRWFVPQGNVDIAFGQLAHPPLIPKPRPDVSKPRPDVSTYGLSLCRMQDGFTLCHNRTITACPGLRLRRGWAWNGAKI
jgi:Skp family chaperone for outer membrane proteins